MNEFYLLDVNLLLALTDPMHVHHHVAHRWFAKQGALAWATCPITENGFVRIASNPKYPNALDSPVAAMSLLQRFCTHTGHEFLPDSITLYGAVLPNMIFTHNHVTDVYLLALAGHHGGKLATLDRRIPTTAIDKGANLLELIG